MTVNHTTQPPRKAARLNTARYAVLVALLGLLLVPTLTATAQQGERRKIFVPLAATGGRQQPPPTTPDPPAPPQPERGGVFPQRDVETTSSAMAVDASGGMHVAYVAYTPLDDEPAAYYGYCAAPAGSCADPARWRTVAVGQLAEEVQLALSPAGQPRMLFRSVPAELGSRVYNYAACDNACTERSSWSQTPVAVTTEIDAADWDLPQHSFALDRQGRPRFVYYTGGLGDPRKGAFYAYCDAACTQNDLQAPHWFETRISSSDDYDWEIFDYPVLAFTQADQPRVVTTIITGESSTVSYLACDSACDDFDNWKRVPLLERGWGPLASWDLELDAADRPRVAIYQEGLDDGGGDQLIYGWCDAECLVEQRWHGITIGLKQGDGETPDLELDGQGRPRIAYHASDGAGLGYAWCDTNCQSTAEQWKTTIAEASATLDASFPLPVPPACERATWSGGYRPSLALDAQGNPRIGSDAEWLMSCRYDDPGDPSKPPQTRIETLRHTRFVFLPQP